MTLNDLEKLVNIKNLHTDVGSAIAIIDTYNVEDVKKILEFLNESGIVLNELRDLRVLSVPLNQIQAKIRNLKDVDALDLARQRPFEVLTLNDGCLTICNRIRTCIQKGINYKDENGNYCSFVWNEHEWNKKKNEVEEAQIVPEKEEVPKEVADNYDDIFAQLDLGDINPIAEDTDHIEAIDSSNEDKEMNPQSALDEISNAKDSLKSLRDDLEKAMKQQDPDEEYVNWDLIDPDFTPNDGELIEAQPKGGR